MIDHPNKTKRPQQQPPWWQVFPQKNTPANKQLRKTATSTWQQDDASSQCPMPM